MRIGKYDLPPIFCGSGTFGIFGEGYAWHKWVKPFVFWLKLFGVFVSKTVTTDENKGNMPLEEDGITLKEKRPKCIFIDFKRWIRGGMLNAVGLSNCGFDFYCGKGRWQKRRKRMVLSFMAIGKNFEDRIDETYRFARSLTYELSGFNTRPIVEMNISCPNVKHGACSASEQACKMLDIFSNIPIPVIVKINTNMPISEAVKISKHPACAAIHISNTIPWNDLPDWIKRKVFPEFTESPLKKYGGGGFSGKYAHPIVVTWITRAQRAGIAKPIIGGGGIFTPMGVWRMYQAGASAVSIASPVIFRPWMIPFIVLSAYVIFWLFPKIGIKPLVGGN